MNITEAWVMARFTLDDLGLENWDFQFDRSTCRFGLCRYREKRIQLSRKLTEVNERKAVLDVVLHEAAHAISFQRYGPRGRGHGSLWKGVCVEIGAIPVRCYNLDRVKPVPGKFELRNMTTGKVYKVYSRKPKRIGWLGHYQYMIGKPETKGKLEIVPTGTPLKLSAEAACSPEK